MKILISNGGQRFHLAPLAAQLSQTEHEVFLMTSYYPRDWHIKLNFLKKNSSYLRFLDKKEIIANDCVFDSPLGELCLKSGDFLRKYIGQNNQQRLHVLGQNIYCNQVKRLLNKLRPNIYHYRNCYGLSSVNYAENLNISSICDHSIAHPLILDFMENHQGAWPSEFEVDLLKNNSLKLQPLAQQMKRDLDRAKFTLVNSDFVKETCIRAGMIKDSIFVVYLGVDEKFFQSILQAKKQSNIIQEPISSLFFAGGWQKRKGIPTLLDALKQLNFPWTLNVAGADQNIINTTNGISTIQHKVNGLGFLPRSDLAKVMLQHRIMIFPSYCEGSARVIFEALAAGCFIITTPNSGSIVQHEKHGLLVPPGDCSALAHAIHTAISNPEWVTKIGQENAELIESNYRQAHYAQNTLNVYSEILSR